MATNFSPTSFLKSKPGKKRGIKFGLMAGAVSIGAIALGGAGILDTNATALSQSPTPIAATQGAQALAQLPRNQAGVFSFADIVEQVSPSVVSVFVEREVEAPSRPRGLPEGFERFFGFPGAPEGGADNDDPFEEEGVQRAEAQGSGFFVDNNGHVITNHHVIADAKSVKISLSDGTEYDAEIVGSDERTDLAVLKVKSDDKFTYVPLADDSSLRVGDWVVAVGNPFGLGGTVTTGIVSAIGGRNREQQYLDLIQIDAAINRGNSGGPAFDLTGRVIGVNVAIYSPNGGSVGIGFAIPASTVRLISDQLIANGSVTRGWLGISLAPVTSDIAEALDLSNDDGVLVSEVIDGTPAAKGGLEDGDVITALDGVEVNGPNDLSRRIANLPPGRKVKVNLVRDGSNRTVNITLEKRPGETDVVASAEPAEETTAEELGVRIATITDEERRRYRLEDVDGVVVTAVKSGSPAERAGLQRGVVILEVDSKAISSASDFENAIEKLKKSKKGAALLRLQRGSVKQFSALKLDAE